MRIDVRGLGGNTPRLPCYENLLHVHRYLVVSTQAGSMCRACNKSALGQVKREHLVRRRSLFGKGDAYFAAKALNINAPC